MSMGMEVWDASSVKTLTLTSRLTRLIYTFSVYLGPHVQYVDISYPGISPSFYFGFVKMGPGDSHFAAFNTLWGKIEIKTNVIRVWSSTLIESLGNSATVTCYIYSY